MYTKMYTVLRHKQVWTTFEEGMSRSGDPNINRISLLPRMDVWTEQRRSTSFYKYHKI